MVLPSNACADEYSAEYSVGTLCSSPGSLLFPALSSLLSSLAAPATLVSPALSSVSAQGQHQALLGVPALWPENSLDGRLWGLASLVSHLSEITVLHCLVSSILKTTLGSRHRGGRGQTSQEGGRLRRWSRRLGPGSERSKCRDKHHCLIFLENGPPTAHLN